MLSSRILLLSFYSRRLTLLLQCIMQHESGGNANAANENTNGSFDIGLWQINSVNWASWYDIVI